MTVFGLYPELWRTLQVLSRVLTLRKHRLRLSIALLRRVVECLEEAGLKIGNIDATILCQRPKLAPHIPQMRQILADACGVDVTCVSVKATTEEGLGFTGSGEGIAAHCVYSNKRCEIF